VQQLVEAVLQERLGEAVGQAVVDDTAVLPRLDEPRGTQQPKSVARGVLGHSERERQVTDTELFYEVERIQQTHSHGVAEQPEEARQPGGIGTADELSPCAVYASRIDGMIMIQRHIRMVARIYGRIKAPGVTRRRRRGRRRLLASTGEQ